MVASSILLDEKNENDSFSQQVSLFTAVIKELRSFKTIIHMSDDIIITTLTAADLGEPVWESLGDLAVGAVLLIVTAIELQETNDELEELQTQLVSIYDELAFIQGEEKNQELAKRRDILLIQLAHREDQISKILINQKLCMLAIAVSAIYASAMILSTLANALIQLQVSYGNVLMGGLTTAFTFTGMAFFPPLVMAIILIKQMIDLSVLHDKLHEQQEILDNPSASPEEKAKAKKEIEKIQMEIKYKRVEISAQALLTISFILAAIALSSVSFGCVPLILMIAGAAIGLLCKVHELYTKNKAKIKNLENKVEQKVEENRHVKKELIHACQQVEDELENKIRNLEKERQEKNLQIAQLEQNNQAKDSEIAKLKEKLNEFEKSQTKVTNKESGYSPMLFHVKCVPPNQSVHNKTKVDPPIYAF